MILDTHASLEAFLRSRSLGRSGVTVTFEVPTKAWAAARKEATVNCFLYDVRENQAVKHTGTQALRDDAGRVVGHRPVPRYLDHCYLLSTWAPDAGTEHRILSAVLGALLVHDTLPRELLQGELAQQPRHVVLSVAQGGKRGMLLSLGGEQRLALEVELSVPWSGGPDEMVSGYVEQAPRITVLERAPGAPPVRRRTTVLPPAAPVLEPSAAPAAAGATAAPAKAPAAQPAAEPSPPARPDPLEVGARLLAQVATRLLAQLPPAGTAAADEAEAQPGAQPATPPAQVPTQRAVAQLGAQVGRRVAALVEAGDGPVPSPQAEPTPAQLHAARLGAQAAVTLLGRLQAGVAPAGDGAAPTPPTAQQAAALGSRVGAALARQIVAAADGQQLAGAAPAGTAPAP